jgi:hypothetical protein
MFLCGPHLSSHTITERSFHLLVHTESMILFIHLLFCCPLYSNCPIWFTIYKPDFKWLRLKVKSTITVSMNFEHWEKVTGPLPLFSHKATKDVRWCIDLMETILSIYYHQWLMRHSFPLHTLLVPDGDNIPLNISSPQFFTTVSVHWQSIGMIISTLLWWWTWVDWVEQL